MEISLNNEENIIKGSKIIKNGGLVAFPTETVYGLGADVFNPIAIAKIFEAKQRPFFDPLIAHVDSLDKLKTVAIINDCRIEKIIDKFWPGPLTLILPKRENVPDIVTSGLNTVAVRMPNHDTALKLIKNSGTAVAAPSANPFGYLSPTKAIHVYEQLNNKIDMILDGGDCEIGVESTILDLTKEIPVILRPGGLPKEEIEKLIGKVDSFDRSVATPTAPGQLPSHYSPRKDLYILYNGINNNIDFKNSAYLSFGNYNNKEGFKVVKNLSKNKNMLEAAANLFSLLHELDKEDVEKIYVEKISDVGIGKAIMDRLFKASKK